MSLATLPLTGNERLPLDTQLSSGTPPQSEASSLSQIATMMGGNLPLAASRFYGLPTGATPGTLLTVTGTLYAYPYYVSGPSTIETIGIDTTTGQTGGAAFVGIYADNGSGYPGSLVTSSNNTTALIATSGAAVQNYTPTSSILLQAGWYWLASIFTATSTFPTVASVSATYTPLSTQLGSDTALHLAATSGQAATGVSVAATYGTLNGINSGVFPTSATLTLNAGTPLVILGT
jgi:hypothetical protein